MKFHKFTQIAEYSKWYLKFQYYIFFIIKSLPTLLQWKYNWSCIKILWWEIDEMNENGNLKELMKKMKERENVLKVKKFIKSIWLYFYLALFLMISDWFDQMNEVETEMNQFYINIVQTVLFRENSVRKFLSYKNSFHSIKIKEKNWKWNKMNDKSKIIIVFHVFKEDE